MKKTIRAILVVAGICVWGHAAHAAQPFMTVPSTGFDYASNGNDGFLFTPTSDLLVNALDYYVSPDAAVPYTLNNSHGVAIYTMNTGSDNITKSTAVISSFTTFCTYRG